MAIICWLLLIGFICLRNISLATLRVVDAPSIWLDAIASSIIELTRYTLWSFSGIIPPDSRLPPKLRSNSCSICCILPVTVKWNWMFPKTMFIRFMLRFSFIAYQNTSGATSFGTIYFALSQYRYSSCILLSTMLYSGLLSNSIALCMSVFDKLGVCSIIYLYLYMQS